MKPLLNLFTDDEIDAVCTATRRVLAEKGLRFVVPEVVQVFRDRGFQIVDDDVVRISSDELDAALGTAPRSFVRRGAMASRDVRLGDGETKFGVGSLPIWVIEQEPQVERRAATLDDFRRFTLLSEALDGFVIGNPVVQPQEVPVEVMHLLWNRNNAVRMTKPVCCWYGTNFEAAREGLEVLRLAAGGMDALRSSRRWALTVCPDGALQWGKTAIAILEMAEAEVPVEVVPTPFLGSMHPVTMAGALVQSAAEVMGIVVLTQLLRPGCPVLYAASYGGIMDMASASHALGAPESALLAAASAAVGQAFGLPTDMMQGISDSKLPDAQAALEKTMALLMPTLAGADCVTMAGGLIDFALSASYEQLLMDEEIVNSVRRIARGSLVNEETLAEGVIMELPFGGQHLDSEHTYKHYRNELFFTKLADRRSWEVWWQDGAKDMAGRARGEVERILASAQPVQGVPEENQRAVDKFVADVCRRQGVDPEPLLY